MDTMDDMDKLDAIQQVITRLDDGVETLFCLHLGMESGDYTSDTFAPAVGTAYEYLSGLVLELRKLTGMNVPEETAAA